MVEHVVERGRCRQKPCVGERENVSSSNDQMVEERNAKRTADSKDVVREADVVIAGVDATRRMVVNEHHGACAETDHWQEHVLRRESSLTRAAPAKQDH